MKPRLIIDPSALTDTEKPPQSKIAEDRLRAEIGERSQQRQISCWMKDATGCSADPIMHVQEIGFDFRDISARSRTFMLSSKDMTGPVPGFCAGCLPKVSMLAEIVYNMRPETRFGLRLNRWVIRFTDGSSAEGLCEQFAVHRMRPHYSDRPLSHP